MKFENITTKDGLAANRVLCMAIDSLGYRWYGTSLGASRFDGVHYDNFTNIANDIPEISSNSIRDIICYKEDIIFLNSDGLLYTYNLEKSLTKLVVFKINDQSNNLIKIRNICKSTIENIVFGFDIKNNMYKINIKKLTYELAYWSNEKDTLFNKVLCSINIGNSIWIGADNGLFEFDIIKNKIHNIPFAHIIPNTSKNYAVGSIDRFDENSIVFGSSSRSLSKFKGMILYNKKLNKIERLDRIGFNNEPLSSLYCKVSSIKDSLLCIIPAGKGPIIYNFKTNTYDTIPVTKNKNQLNTISIGPCHMDDKGKFTICTNQGLFIHEPFSSAFEEKFPYKDFNPAPAGQSSCYYDKKRHHLLMSSAKCIRIFDYKVDSTIKLIPYPFIQKHHIGIQEPILLYFGNDSILIIGSYLYLFDMNKETLTVLEPNNNSPNPSVTSDFFPYILDPENKENILFFRDGKLNCFIKKKCSLLTFKITNEINQEILLNATGIDKDKENNLWVTTYNLGLLKLKKNTSNSYTAQFLTTVPNNLKLNDVYIDSENSIWIASKFGGLIKYNSRNNTYIQFNSNYGFSVNYINQINEDNYGKLWMATSYGISSFDKKTYEVFNYDGQNGIGFPHNLFRGKTKDEYNNLYLSSGIGFIKIDPKIFLKTTIGPPVYIKKFSINNQEIAAFWKDTTITIDAYNNDFSFVISAINHTHGHLNKYKYILENYHEKWVNISKNQLNVSFNNLDAGQYIFRAIACNHLGDWNLKGINITINILPYWYHTWWFRLLILIIVLGLIYYIYKLVLNRKLAIQKAEFDQKTAIYNERNRIARDMHDDISSGLSAIHLIANHIQSMPNHQIFDNEINYIIKSSNEINQNIREIIWSVNSDSDTILNLSIFIKQYIYTLSESIENTSFKYYSNEKLPLIYISGEKRRNIYLCVKEAINNALKHANATYIKVIFEFNLPNIISIKIIDNGVGFDPNINLLSNYGLKNMKNRIENIGGKFSVEVNDLTTIHLEITII